MWARPDKARVRCGGPAFCKECSYDLYVRELKCRLDGEMLKSIQSLRDDFYRNTKHVGAGDIDRSYAMYLDRLLDGLNKILDKE
jgi:hypothetical protein